MTPTNHQNVRTSSAVSEGAEAGLTLKRGLGGQHSALRGLPPAGETLAADGAVWGHRSPRVSERPVEAWGGSLPTRRAAPRSAVRRAERGKEVGGARLQRRRKVGRAWDQCAWRSEGQAGVSAAAREDPPCGRVPRSQSHVPRVTADLCLQMGASTQKLPKAPNCPASRGRSRDGRDSPALPGSGRGVGGASWQSRSVQSRKRKKKTGE